ncbi:carboxylate--amine ligase [Gordonia sp. NB41Y]|uniref:carboxylate--amine ligase n=1 Tax=Gordonia sp. NB41Y TaxID=875808 RepID=UPI0006B22EBC|nr:carboxylate--amine ligase [Gordonia sp. NB41Y]EMP13845.2 carboxylate--amine ligase [Gordonia sp. NB41Y]WLP88989.1 carboxylate--amine ligase [Gordonia sp. NB41Y]
MTSSGKHVLITFGRSFLSLNLARLLAAGGHRVTTVDSIPVAITRVSNAVTGFHKVPPPKFAPQEYCRELARIVRAESVDMVIPIHEETDVLSMMQGLFPAECQLFLSDFELENRLHNKFEFQAMLDERGVPTLKYAQFASRAEIAGLDFDGPFAVKQVYSRGSQKVHKVYPGDPMDWLEFDDDNPWLAQQWLHGDRYCTYSVVRDGKIFAHATYPVGYAIGGSSCLSFTNVHHQGIFDWVTDFLADTSFTGQVGFDFIDHPDDGLYTIECNPRATSGIMMFRPHNRVDQAFFGTNDELITPDDDVERMIKIGMALYGWRADARQGRTMKQYFHDMRTFDDVIGVPGDRKPGVLLPAAYAGILRSCVKYRVGLAEGFMHDHEWDGHTI